MKTTLPILTALAVLLPATIAAAEIPRPEHPRPDLFREAWMTLNGGPNKVVVQVEDNQWSGLQPRGKQADGESRNVFYTRINEPPPP